MKVEVYTDIACPWCRLGTHQFHRAVAAAGAEPDVELIHRPYQLFPARPRSPGRGGTWRPRCSARNKRSRCSRR
ncbi:hypothetical protein C1J01_15840 [Nonomuraea aridisoli]|uniref:DSBA-like thioredoxin domain-containing protein n=1 Tax=Nonomuraea aridisoli TaxID=2070368 RepID=A0A2W2F985_9ACTN|nr:hypothetical protein C1J01_15840 [Nonomuraea aridisoli]